MIYPNQQPTKPKSKAQNQQLMVNKLLVVPSFRVPSSPYVRTLCMVLPRSKKVYGIRIEIEGFNIGLGSEVGNWGSKGSKDQGLEKFVSCMSYFFLFCILVNFAPMNHFLVVLRSLKICSTLESSKKIFKQKYLTTILCQWSTW